MSFRERYGPWALVTGASSGIGDAFARELAARGLHVALVARRRDRLTALAAELEARHRVEALVIEADLARPDFLGVVEAALGGRELGLLVNNAGFGEKGPFLDTDRDALARMLDTNCKAPMLLTHALAPRLVARGRGGVVFTSSTAAFQGLPYSTHYAATKGYDLQLAEGLFHELRPRGVDVVALCPGPTDTEGPRRTGVDPDRVPLEMMSPAEVARAGLDALGRAPIVVPGAANRGLTLLVKLAPRRWSAALAGRMMRRAIGGPQKP